LIKTYKVRLEPNKEQEQKMWQSAGTARWAYNWTLNTQQENRQNGGKFIQDGDLRKSLTELKKTEEFNWLNNYSNNVTKQAVKDACHAYKSFFNGRNKFPKFKSRKKSKPSFYQDTAKIKFSESHVRLEKIGWVRMSETNRIPQGKYFNPRVTHDGLHWFISVGIEIEQPILDKSTTEPIGIDLGIKELAIVSTGEVVKNINKTKEVRRLTKKLKRLQRQASRQYEKLKKQGGESRCEKTSNLLKLEKEILKIHQRLKNIRTNHIHQSTSKLVKNKPEYIVIEDLNVSGMVKNKHLARAIQEQKLYEFRRQLIYKCQWYGVRLIIADRFYPSSKICSQCGQIKRDLKLSDRVYYCDCGLRVDRDLNASINLREYGKLAS